MGNDLSGNSGDLAHPVFLTEAELAARWRHSLRTLQRWRAAGYGPAHVRIGNRVVYRRTAIEAFEANREADE